MDRYQSCELLIQKFACLSKVADVVDFFLFQRGFGFLGNRTMWPILEIFKVIIVKVRIRHYFYTPLLNSQGPASYFCYLPQRNYYSDILQTWLLRSSERLVILFLVIFKFPLLNYIQVNNHWMTNTYSHKFPWRKTCVAKNKPSNLP